MSKEYITFLLEENKYEKLLEELDYNIVSVDTWQEIAYEEFTKWNFEIVSFLQIKELVNYEYIDSLILKNTNLVTCVYMLNYLNNIDSIISNMETIILNKKKTIHIYNMIMGMIRNIVLNNNLELNKRNKVLDLYFKYADIDNLYECFLKLEDNMVDDDNNKILLSRMINNFQNSDNLKEIFSMEIDKFSNKNECKKLNRSL